MGTITREQAEAEYAHREALYQTAAQSECARCHRQMGVRLEGGQPVVRCQTDPTHEGYRKLRSLTRLAKEGAYIPWVSEHMERRKETAMIEELQEHGLAAEESRALAIYGERVPISQAAATRIIDLFYPNAPLSAKAEAAILAAQYNLNPLPSRREMYIVGFKDESAVVLGIASHRILARRKALWSYVDIPDCPTSPFRPMGRDEIEAIGEDYDGKVWATVTLDVGNKRYSGIGNYSRTGRLIGEDKGNTRWDMACKRAEAKALSRIVPPEELPAPVIEGVYADITEIIESPKIQAPRAAKPTERQQASPQAPGGGASDIPAEVVDMGELGEAQGVDEGVRADLAVVEKLTEAAGFSLRQIRNRIRTKFQNREFGQLTPEERDQVKKMLEAFIAAKAAPANA